MKEIHSSLA